MKTIAAIALLTLVSTIPAQAETSWIGNAFVVIAPQPACGNTVTTGDFYNIIYRPAGEVLGNGADSYLALVSQRSNFTMLTPNNTFRGGINYAARYVSSQINFGSSVGGITAWSMSPVSLAVNVRDANLTFTITNFFKIAGCNPTFRADLGLSL